MLKIWGRISSINVRKVVLCAQMLNIPFQRTEAGLSFGVVNTPDYLMLNPNAMVPTIQDGEYTLWESNAIVRYLCARENQLYPSDLQTRFTAEQWMDWQQTSLNRASGPAFVQWIRTPESQRNHDLIAQSVAATEPLLDLLDQQLQKQAFIAGAQMSMADLPIACEVHRWWGLPQSRPRWPHLERWYALMRQHPGAAGVLDLPLS
ncbi:glutathione S-transferase [Limnohabitans sp.]|uniref:glutathione S-transferase family protein n=1 Tax=Limnohabitans sp. TaxID=1907725 RepID=UPI00333E935D